MAYFLDTHAALGALKPSAANLSGKVRELLERAPGDIVASPVSAYELGFKAAARKMHSDHCGSPIIDTRRTDDLVTLRRNDA